MEWQAHSPDHNPVENLWGDIKNAVSETKPRHAEELWNVVQWSWPWEYLVTGARSCLTPCSADVKQFSETEVTQLSISSVIQSKA